MSFFDDKQEILKVELTTYGRYLLSRGRFKPAYYAFFDDEILYDAEYADIKEEQNEIQTRILEESVYLKPQTTYKGVENLKQEQAQISIDKNHALSLPLANSSLTAENMPAWSLNVIKGSIKEVVQNIDNTNNSFDLSRIYANYPQIFLNDVICDIKTKINDSSTEQNYNIIYNIFFEDGKEIYYSMKQQEILLELSENNVDDLIKNFDVEVFIEEETSIDGTTKKSLRQLVFNKQRTEILDGILLDEPIEYGENITEDSVEYYFEITVDNEIELPPTQASKMVNYRGGGRPSYKPPFGDNC